LTQKPEARNGITHTVNLSIIPDIHARITTFTCQATARKNETARSDVIVPFGLHVWKSFTCGRRYSVATGREKCLQ